MLNNNNVDALVMKGKYLQIHHNYNEAIKNYKAALKVDGKILNALF